jgi:hypothetical protein
MGRHRTEPDDGQPGPSPSITEDWIGPDRRTELRAGAVPSNPWEADFQASYLRCRRERRAADDRRS